MSAVGITISNDGFKKDFGLLLGETQKPEAMLAVVGRELGNRLKDHFRKRDKENPNKLSSRREHFWLQVSQSVHAAEVRGNQVSVWVSDPRIGQKVFGGTIKAKRAGALTIPVEERAYGRTAATFEKETGVKLILIKTGGKGGNFENAVLAAREKGGLTVEYLLTKSVTQDADPDALPSDKELQEAVLERAKKFLEREKANT